MYPRTQRTTFLAIRLFTRDYRNVPGLEDVSDAHLLPLVAIVGRPNVGKSALFNRLVRKRDALVYDTPGDHVTRDYQEGLGQLGDLQFRLIDTSGLEPSAPSASLQGRTAALTRSVLQGSHGVLMLLDARQGVVPADEALLGWLRRNSRAPLMMLANKADTAAGRNNLDALQADLAGLGLEPATAISATSGEGLADLYQLLQPIVDEGVQQLNQRAGLGSRSSRQLVPPAYRFSAPNALQQQQQQDQKQQQQGGDAVGSIPRGTAAEQQQQQEEAALAAAAAAEADEVDRLVQQQQLAAGNANDSDEEAIIAVASSNSSSSTSPSSAPAVHDEALGDEPEGGSGGSSGSGAPLRMAILGLPNAGKSTLMNTLLGYERSLTGPEPGLTRDPTSGWLEHAGMQLQLIDTAGWKRAAALAPTQSPTTTAAPQKGTSSTAHSADNSSSSKADSMTTKVLADASLAQAKRALSAVHVAVLLLDARRLLTIGQAITRLELQIAGLALSQGKALVIGLNKADAVPGGATAAEALREQVAELLEQKFLAAGRLPVVALSGLQGDGAEQLLDAVVQSYSKWNKRVSAYKLRDSLAKHALRFFGTGGTANLLGRIKWATQLKPRPPTFVLLLRGSEEVDEGGQRFLANVLRQSLGMQGVPLRLYLRYNKPPQQQKKSRKMHGRGRR